MKSLVTLIAVCIIGYWLYTFYQQNPDDLPPMVRRQKNVEATPTPDAKAADAAPKLDSIQVVRGPTLTHAKVKSARPNSIVFLCDQGIFEVNYDRLPPEFQNYYMPAPVQPTAEEAAAAAAAAAAAPAPAAPAPPKIAPARSFEEENAARLAYAQTKASLESRQQSDLDRITRWYKQSNFDPGGMTQQEFDSVKADYDAATAQLNLLVAQGP